MIGPCFDGSLNKTAVKYIFVTIVGDFNMIAIRRY